MKTPFYLTSEGIGKQHICPRDHRPGCSFVDTLAPKHRRRCTHFLSWTWSYSLSDVKTGLMEALRDEGEQETAFLFMCFFVNNQYRILVDGASSGSDNLETVFEDRLTKIGKMIALLDTWDKPTYL